MTRLAQTHGSTATTERSAVNSDAVTRTHNPSADEPFMSEAQNEYFHDKLLAWREDMRKQLNETLGQLQDHEEFPDVLDRATSETSRDIALRDRDRQRKLIDKINAALGRLEDGTYGYCEQTGEPIGLQRLEAHPIATLSVQAQEEQERRQRLFRKG